MMPQDHNAPPVAVEAGEHPAATGRGGTILLVDDDQAVLRITERMLKRLGYTVIQAVSPSEAVERILPLHGSSVDLLLTDVFMPGMDGCELAARMSTSHPAVRTLFMSGYTNTEIAGKGLSVGSSQFLAKPFSYDSLARMVREVLEKDWQPTAQPVITSRGGEERNGREQ